MKLIFQLFRKSRVLQALMALSFLITGVIVAYAVHTNNKSGKALESALEDKVRFASWIYNNTAEEGLKQSTYQTLKAVLHSVNENDRQLSINLSPKRFNQNENDSEGDECGKNYLKPIQSVFVYGPDSDQIENISAGDEVDKRFEGWIKSKIEETAPTKGRLYSKLYIDNKEKEYAVFFARSPGLSSLNRELIFGVKTEVVNLKDLFKDVWENQDLVPASVTGNQNAEDIMAIEVLTKNGSGIFSSGDPSDKRISVGGELGKEFGVLKKNMAISKPAGSNLVSAGLHGESNIILIILFSLAAGLGVIAFLQFKHKSKLIRMKRDFISNVSHELRTPVTQIRMFSETLLNGRTRDEDDVKKSLKIIEKESRRLSRLISNILDLTGKENLIFETSPEIVEVDREIRETIQGFNPMADLASNNINLDLESITARIDPAGLKQILTNILDNAIKYGPEGQEIDIRLRKEESSMVLSILDEGPGIPEEIHDKVWQSNWRKDNSEKHSESGSGIGLFVVKQYLQQMNGSVEIKNREGEGTKFAIRFPINLGE